VSLVSEGDPEALFTNQEKIGEGSAATIYRATAPDGSVVAVKKMKLTAQNTKLMTSEIAIMKAAKHPNIIKYFDSYLINQSHLCVIIEFMSCGCITDILDAWEDFQVDERQIARISKDVSSIFIVRLVLAR
jgi:serine/threonine protein kinase